MSVIQGFKNIFTGYEDDMDQEEEEYRSVYEDNKKSSASAAPSQPKVEAVNYSRPQSSSRSNDFDSPLKIVLARPEKFSEVTEIGTDINAKKTVLLNLENVKSDDAKRILDFISGVAYANDAKIKMMAQKTFAIIPSNVQFVGDDLMSELENNGYSF